MTVLVSEELKLIFLHIPKTGGKSVVATLRGMTQNIRRFNAIDNWHIQASRVKDLMKDDWDHYRSFAVVRNPWDRMVSAYAYSTNHRVSFDAFVSGDLDFMRNPRWVLTKPQIHWTHDDNGNCLIKAICRYENLQDDFAKVCPTAPPILHLNTSEHRPYQDYYTTGLRDCVGELFAADIAAFGYEF